MKMIEGGRYQDNPVQGGIYSEAGSMGEFKVLAVGRRYGSETFAVQMGFQISLFPWEWWKTLFPGAELVRVVDSDGPEKGEGELLDGRVYLLLNIDGYIELLPCSHEDDDQTCKRKIH